MIERMWIEYIKLKNYRCWKDEKVEFSNPKKKKNVNLIEGRMGSGKTVLLNAIIWCLYGEEPYASKSIENSTKKKEERLNNIAESSLDPHESDKVEVEIKFQGKNESWIIERTQTWEKRENGTLKKYEPKSRARLETDQGTSRADPRIFSSNRLPKSLYQYFFFAGEDVNDYFTTSGANLNKIKKAIRRVAQIDILSNMVEHIRKSKKRLTSKIGEEVPKVKDAEEKVNRKEREIKEVQEAIKKTKKKKKKAKEKVEEYGEKLKKSNDEKIKNLQQKREDIKRRLPTLKKQKRELQEKRRILLLENCPVILTLDSIFETKKKLEASENAGIIPANVKKRFIKKLLEEGKDEDGKCICGATLKGNSKKVKKRRRKLKLLYEDTDEITNISSKLTELNTRLADILEEETINNFEDKIDDINKEIKNKKKMIENKNEGLDEINAFFDQRDGVSEEKRNKWNRRLKKFEGEKERCNKQIGGLKEKMEGLEGELDNVQEELGDVRNEKDEWEETNKNIDFLEEAEKKAKEIKKEIVNAIREETEAETEKQFLNYHWKKTSFDKVKLHENYDVSLINSRGREKTQISRGERKCLGISFMAALNKVSGFNSPIVIDSPFTEIGEGAQRQIAKILPKVEKGKQIIFFVKPQRYRAVRDEMQKHMNNKYEYKIKYSETENGEKSEVVNYSKNL